MERRRAPVARFVVAPMVDASELAWRLLCRRRGAGLCYSPMYHADVFLRDAKYRRDALASCPEDRPLIVQFCGNDPETLTEAARIAAPHCDAVDVNLGCPQAIARRGRYGAFLQDDWPLLREIVGRMSRSLDVPVACKIRVFEDVAKTVSYARTLEDAGCSLLAVHGRTREQRGALSGLASWEHVRAVKAAVSVPVIANGNVRCLEDARECLRVTGADGVMSAEGILSNPWLFCGGAPPVWEPAEEYLDLVALHPCPASFVRGHLFKLCHRLLESPTNADARTDLAEARTPGDFRSVVSRLRERYGPFHSGDAECPERGDPSAPPPWICQPRVRRPAPDRPAEEPAEGVEKRFADSDGNPLSRKRMKKLRRISRRPPRDVTQPPRSGETCAADCPNPRGGRCVFLLCKRCCKDKCFAEVADCTGHRILIKTRRERVRSEI